MIYVTSDWHGYPLAEIKQLFKKARFSGADYCFVLGDVIDCGEDGVEILKWLSVQPNIELVMGDHEAMLLDCAFLFDGSEASVSGKLTKEQMGALSVWMQNDAEPTINALKASEDDEREDILDYLRDLPLYETVTVNGRDFVLVHAGFDGFHPDKKISDYEPCELYRADPQLTDRYFDDMTTVFGHTPTSTFDPAYEGKLLKTDSWIDVDTGSAYGDPPMLLRLDDMREFYL